MTRRNAISVRRDRPRKAIAEARNTLLKPANVIAGRNKNAGPQNGPAFLFLAKACYKPEANRETVLLSMRQTKAT